jgi:hypothetical protein
MFLPKLRNTIVWRNCSIFAYAQKYFSFVILQFQKNFVAKLGLKHLRETTLQNCKMESGAAAAYPIRSARETAGDGFWWMPHVTCFLLSIMVVLRLQLICSYRPQRGHEFKHKHLDRPRANLRFEPPVTRTMLASNTITNRWGKSTPSISYGHDFVETSCKCTKLANLFCTLLLSTNVLH